MLSSLDEASLVLMLMSLMMSLFMTFNKLVKCLLETYEALGVRVGCVTRGHLTGPVRVTIALFSTRIPRCQTLVDYIVMRVLAKTKCPCQKRLDS